jgi:hypothetical protein
VFFLFAFLWAPPLFWAARPGSRSPTKARKQASCHGRGMSLLVKGMQMERVSRLAAQVGDRIVTEALQCYL